MSEIFNQEVRRLLLRQIPRTVDTDQQIVVNNYRNSVENFIRDVVTPILSTNKSEENFDPQSVDPVAHLGLNKKNTDLNLQQIPKFFNIYLQGIAATAQLETPFKPFTVTEESVNKIIDYFQNLTMEDYYKLNSRFVKDCFLTLSSWYQDLNIAEAVSSVYGVYKPHEWAEQLENTKNRLDNVPENVKTILNRLQMYIGAN